MKKYISFCLLFFLCLHLCAQDGKCRSLNDLVAQTLKALETKDTALYLEMYSKDKFVEALKADQSFDNDRRNYVLEKIDAFPKVQVKQFKSLLKQMKKQLATDTYKIELVQYEDSPDRIEKNGATTIHTIEIIFVVNGVSRKIVTPIAEYKGCYYYFEPISDNLRTQ